MPAAVHTIEAPEPVQEGVAAEFASGAPMFTTVVGPDPLIVVKLPSAYAAATVVISEIKVNVELFTFAQSPIAATSTEFGLAVFAPVLPPAAVT
jgi:hypothetical protein